MSRYEKAFLNVMLWLIFAVIMRGTKFTYDWEPIAYLIPFALAQICFIFLDKKK
jgi:hypothetical protein